MLETGRLMLRPRDEGDAGVLCRCASDLEAALSQAGLSIRARRTAERSSGKPWRHLRLIRSP